MRHCGAERKAECLVLECLVLAMDRAHICRVLSADIHNEREAKREGERTKKRERGREGGREGEKEGGREGESAIWKGGREREQR